MSISDTKIRAAKTAAVYLIVSLFCSVFGAVYEFFSHGVYSAYMLFCFVPPLTLGCAVFFIIYLAGSDMPCRLAFNLYNSGVASITVGFIMNGVIEIYGTTNHLTLIYFIAGAAFIVAGVIAWIVGAAKLKKTIEK